jgi:hypothetical protein
MAKLPLTVIDPDATITLGQQRYVLRMHGQTQVLETRAPVATAGLPDNVQAELIALGNIPNPAYTQPSVLPQGVSAVLEYIESGVRAYRLIGTDGRSTYTLTAP